MARRTGWVQEYRSLGVLLFVVAAATVVVMSSCGGGGGGGSSGELCSQCGDTDGPCIPTIQYTPDPSLPPPCAPVPGSTASASMCSVNLICRRKSDSAQQRCYPQNPDSIGKSPEVNFQWRCDGSRPGGTAVPIASSTPTEASTAAATPSLCGNGQIDLNEQCDGSNLNNLTCEKLGCTTPLTGGGLACFSNCTLNVSGCIPTCTIQ